MGVLPCMELLKRTSVVSEPKAHSVEGLKRVRSWRQSTEYSTLVHWVFSYCTGGTTRWEPGSGYSSVTTGLGLQIDSWG